MAGSGGGEGYLARIDSGVDAIKKFTDAKNTELFEKMGVFSPRECEARRTVLLEHYIGSVEMEAMTMVDMINQPRHSILQKAELGYVKQLEDSVKTLTKAVSEIHAAADEAEGAALARSLRLDTMIKVREICDEAEGLCPPHSGPSRLTPNSSSSTPIPRATCSSEAHLPEIKGRVQQDPDQVEGPLVKFLSYVGTVLTKSALAH